MAFDVEGARKAGYSDAEIAQFLSEQSNFDYAGATKAGYNPSEVIGFLSKAPAKPAKPAAPTVDFPYTDPMTGMAPGEGLPAPEKKSALDQPGPSTPTPAKDLLLRPEFVGGIKAQLDAMPEEQRSEKLNQLLKRPDVYGRAAKAISDQYAAQDVMPEKYRRMVDTRREVQAERFAEQGASPDTAMAAAIGQAMTGQVGQDLQQATRDIVGEQAAAQAADVKKQLEGAGFAERVGAEMQSRAEKTGMGLMNLYADATNDKEMQSRLSGAMRIGEERGKAIPKGEGIFMQAAQQAIASAGTQAPMLLASALTGSAIPSLALAGIDSFGSSYAEARRAGLSPSAALTRGSLMAAAEVFFERFGMTKALSEFKSFAAANPKANLSKYFARAVAEEVPAELLTTTAQDLVDKAPTIGLRPNLTWDQFLDDLADTLRQTVIQTGAVAGASIGTIKGAEAVGKMAGRLAERLTPEPTYDYEALATKAETPPPPAPPTAEQPPTPPAPPAPPAPEAPEAPAVPTATQPDIEAKVASLVAAGVPEEDARAMVSAAAVPQEKAAPEVLPEVAKRAAEIEDDLVNAGVPPQQAKTDALAKAQQEAIDDAAAEAEGAKRVTEPVSTPSGEGVSVAGEPSGVTTPAGAGVTEPSGVVPTATDVRQPAAGEAAQPSAVETPATTTPTAKRGRPALAPEAKLASDERRKLQRLQANAAGRQVIALEAQLKDALTPVDPATITSEEELANAVADKRRAKVAAVAALYDFSRVNKNKPGQRAAELLKNPAITPQELNAVAAGYEARKAAATATKVAPSVGSQAKSVDPANERMSKVANGAQAVGVVVRTGSLFQKLMAMRLRGFVNGVKVVVLEKGDPLPEALTKGRAAEEWPRSRGLFVQDDAVGTRTVYLRGESEGVNQGINNATVLHELLHAATVQKLYLAQQAINMGFSGDAKLTRAYNDLMRVMRTAQEQFLALGNKNSARVYDIWQRTDGAVFSDPKEFLAYGLTDPDIQKFLMQTQDIAPEQRMYSRFVDAIRRLLGLASDQHTALSNLIDVTDKILSTRKTPTMEFLQRAETKAAQQARIEPTKVAAAAGPEEIKAKPSANVQRLAKMLGSKLYGTPQDIAKVSIKELFQNSFDAIKGALEKGTLTKGKIDIKIDEDLRTITIIDNGLGMPTSVMGNQFLQIAGTVKETQRASGGLGVAKMLFLFENKQLEVVSLRDGVVSRMVTTGDDLKAALDDPSRAPTIQVSSDRDTVNSYKKTLFPDGHGTAVTVTIPMSFTDESTGEQKDISFTDYELKRAPVLKYSPLFDDIEVTVNTGYGPEVLAIGANFPIDKFTPFANVNFAWGTARIYVSKDEVDSWRENTHVLSNGLWQFDLSINDRPGFGGKQIKRDFYIDVTPAPNVKPEDAGYPFDLNRQKFSKAASEDFNKIFNYITVIYSQLDLAKGIKNFGTVQYVNADGTLTKQETLEPKAAPSETAFTLIKPDDDVEVRDGVLYVNNRPLPELSTKDLEKVSIRIEELTIPQDELNPNKVMVHDNTVVAGTEDKSLSDLARERFGEERYNRYLDKIGSTFLLLRTALVAADSSYADLKKEVFGVSIDKEYYGVSIRVPFHGMFINPATTDLHANPKQIAVSMIGTMIHEMAHFKVRNHGGTFASEMQKITTLLDTLPSFDLQGVKSSLADAIGKDIEIFNYLNGEFSGKTLEARGNRFQDSSYQQIGDEGAAEPMESARKPGEGRPGVSEGTGERAAGVGKVGVGAGVSGKAAEAGATEAADDAAKKAASDQRKLEKRVDVAVAKFEASDDATQATHNATLMHSLRSGEDFIRYINAVFKGLNKTRLSAILFALPTDVVAKWGESNDVKNLNALYDTVGKMHGLSRQLLVAAGKVNESMVRAIKAAPELRRKLERVAYESTLARVDPSVNKASTVLNKLWDDLGSEGQRVYKELKGYYANMVDYYGHLLDQQIQDSKLSPEAKKTLMATIKKMYEIDKRIVPFFPLVRNQGDLWVSFGKRSKRQFITFNNEPQRAAVLAMLAKKEGKSVAEFIADNDVRQGDTLESFRSHTVEASDMLREVFGKIDAAKTLDADAVQRLKDSVYELYLATLPEQSFRRGFIARKDIIGFNTDIVRNFSTTATRMSTQLARIKYGPTLRNTLMAAEKSLEGNSDQAKLMRFVDEMKRRVDMELNPYGERLQGVSRAAAKTIEGIGNTLSRMAYVHYLSAAGSAAVQLTSLFYSAANLGARHGYTKTAVELTKLLKFWDEFGITQRNADGTVSFVAPTMAESKRVSLNDDERRAINEMLSRGVSEITLTNEMLGRAQVPSAEYQSGFNKTKRVFWTAVGGLFHTAERISREITFMTSYRLSRKEGKTHEQAVDQAVADTYDSVGNMSQWNRPPIARGPTGRVATQFLMYPLFMTLRIATTFTKMLPFLNKEGKTQALKEFGGIMGVTFMLAGMSGLPLFSTIMGIVGAAFRGLDDKDKPEDLKKLNFELWFRTVFMPNLIGPTEVFGKKLSDIIDRGPTNAFTGLDIASRTSLNDLWFRDSKETRTPREGAVNTAIEHAGPAANMVLSYLDAYQAIADGDMQKAAEKGLPSILRGPVTAMKYFREGAKDYKGAQILAKDAFSTGDLFFQAIGIRQDALANHQKVLFDMSKIENGIRFNRENILNNIADSYMKRDDARFRSKLEEMQKFNRKFPTYVIDADAVESAINRRLEKAGTSMRGFQVSEKNIQLLGAALKPSMEALSKKEQEARK